MQLVIPAKAQVWVHVCDVSVWMREHEGFYDRNELQNLEFSMESTIIVSRAPYNSFLCFG